MVRGYKAFDKDLKCRGGMQYKIGKTAEHDGMPKAGKYGSHFCEKITDVFNYYKFDRAETRICEVIAHGDVDREEFGGVVKCATNKLEIVRELTWEEVLALCNTGKSCTGVGNTGDNNTGDYNAGVDNTGNRNTGHNNAGNRNTGHGNPGNRNTGDGNTGDHNTGSYNPGNRNTGDNNTGNYNTGNRNVGNFNTGNRNTGNHNANSYNTGDYNNGHSNTGDGNTGNNNAGDDNTGNNNTGSCNTGCYNEGCRNTGHGNTCDNSNGVFCTVEPTINFFNKPSDMTLSEFSRSRASRVLDCYFRLSEWVQEINMTEEEKEEHPEYKIMGGYLRTYEYKEAWRNAWRRMNYADKDAIKGLPNFDPIIFEEITGIKVY